MSEETIVLDQFHPREYQKKFLKALRSGTKNFCLCWHRRSGKDKVTFNALVPFMLERPIAVYYIFKRFSHGRRILWDNLDIEGNRALAAIPNEAIAKINNQRQFIQLRNNSTFQVIGSQDFDNTLIGTNIHIAVFSEYSMQSPEVAAYVSPILNASNGISIYLSTPRGHNHFYDLFMRSKNSPYWFNELLTVDDTGAISLDQIEEDIKAGRISRDKALQEYWCDFSRGIENCYYSAILEEMRENNQITSVPYDPTLGKVYTSWDIGFADPTCIIFWQQTPNQNRINIIDYYEASNKKIEHFVKVVLDKPWVYGGHYPPHDIMVHEQYTGQTRFDMYKAMGIHFQEPIKVKREDGIEQVKCNLPKMWIDEKKCDRLIKAIENYRQEFNETTQQYNDNPEHDQWSHPADALRYMCLALPKLKEGMTAQDAQALYNRVNYNPTNNLGNYGKPFW